MVAGFAPQPARSSASLWMRSGLLSLHAAALSVSVFAERPQPIRGMVNSAYRLVEAAGVEPAPCFLATTLAITFALCRSSVELRFHLDAGFMD